VSDRSLPTSPLDVFEHDVLAEPYTHYRAIRDMGPVVYLERYDAYAVGRFEDVRAALKGWKTFKSTHGTAFNELMNQNASGTVLSMAPPEHTRFRAAMMQRLRLSSVRDLASWVQREADTMVRSLVTKGTFEVSDGLATPLPAKIAGELIGLNPDAMDSWVEGSHAVFAAMGPMNAKAEHALGKLAEILEMVSTLKESDLAPGSIGAELYQAAARGDIPDDSIVKLLWNFAGPAFDTTVHAINNLVWLLANNPDQFDLLRDEPSLISSACNETLRIESPVQIWSRYCDRDTEVGGQMIPADSRVAILLGSANRDERRYREPDRFDVRRSCNDMLAFGFGIHICVGASLARLEMEAVLRSLVENVSRVEVLESERRTNNTTRGFQTLTVAVS
jgi:cytochrome P450